MQLWFLVSSSAGTGPRDHIYHPRFPSKDGLINLNYKHRGTGIFTWTHGGHDVNVFGTYFVHLLRASTCLWRNVRACTSTSLPSFKAEAWTPHNCFPPSPLLVEASDHWFPSLPSTFSHYALSLHDIDESLVSSLAANVLFLNAFLMTLIHFCFRRCWPSSLESWFFFSCRCSFFNSSFYLV